MGSWQGQQRARRAWCAWSLFSLGLAGCGKDGTEPPPPAPPPAQTFTVGGTVSGLVGSLTLINNGGDARTVEADGSFTFSTPLTAGAAYAVSVQAQPANQSCVVSAGTGTVAAAVTGVTVACETVRASATIGAAGGTLQGPDGVQVEIPAGALTQDTLIGVARSATDTPSAPTANLAAARVYEFTPHDLVFEVPVIIRMPVPAGATEPAALFSGVGADWMEVDALIQDGVAVIERNTFSWGGIYVCAYLPGDPDLDPGGCVNPRGTLALSATPASGLTTVAGAATPRRHHMTAAGTVHFTFSYHVPASCTNGSVRLRRTRVQANGQTVLPLQILSEQPAPMLINNVAPPGRAADGSVMFNVPVSEADDGHWYYQAQLLCTHRTGPRAYTLTVILDVDVDTPPPQPPVYYSVGGMVSGLTGTGLVLQNNAGDDLAITSNGAFTFASDIAAGSAYNVSVRTQPGNPAQFCSLQNAAGTAGNHVTNVAVSCAAVTGRNWRTPQLIDANGVGEAESPRVSFDAAGNATAVWTFVTRDPVTGNPTSEIWSNRYTPASGWGTPARVTQIVDGGVEDLNLGVLANGEVVAAWVQSSGWDDDLYSSRFIAGSGWSQPALVEQLPAEVKSLRLAFPAAGAGFAVWLQETGPFETEDVWASRYVAGSGWSAPALLELRDDGAGDPAIAVSNDGTAMAVWGQNDGDSALRMNRYVPGTGWTGDVSIAEAVDYPNDELVVAMDDAGRAVVAYTNNGFSGGVFGLRYANGSWGPLEALRPGPLFYPARLTVAMRGAGEALVMWVEGEGLSNMWAKPFGVLTGNAVQAGDDRVGGLRPRVVFDADGTALAAWNYGGAVMASRYTHGAPTPWSVPTEVSPDVSASDVQLAIDAAGNAMAVWQQNVSSSHSDIAANVLR